MKKNKVSLRSGQGETNLFLNNVFTTRAREDDKFEFKITKKE